MDSIGERCVLIERGSSTLVESGAPAAHATPETDGAAHLEAQKEGLPFPAALLTH
jgi:hypothetical protein